MSRSVLPGVALGAVVTALFALGAGCLTRPVIEGNPVTTFTVGYGTTAIDKVDILFDIDNSSSMGDKQQYLQAAIPTSSRGWSRPTASTPGATHSSTQRQSSWSPTRDTAELRGSGQAEFAARARHARRRHHVVARGPRARPRSARRCPRRARCLPSTTSSRPGSYQTYLDDTRQRRTHSGLTAISKNNDDQAHLINRTDPPTDPDAAPVGR